MAENTFLYFAYGSNLLKERLTMMNPSAAYVTNAKLQDYKLYFGALRNVSTSRWRGGAASIQQDEGSHVWGAVWRLHNDHIKTLDKQEGWYTAFQVNVTTATGETLTCRTYQMNRTGDDIEDGRPSPQYKDVILRGAKGLVLPEEYIQFLESCSDNGYQGDVPVYNEILKLLDNPGSS